MTSTRPGAIALGWLLAGAMPLAAQTEPAPTSILPPGELELAAYGRL